MTFKAFDFYSSHSSWIHGTYSVGYEGTDIIIGIAIEFRDGYRGVWMGKDDSDAQAVASGGGTYFHQNGYYGAEDYRNVELI